jgi:periplasmic protein CpxP/Spy
MKRIHKHLFAAGLLATLGFAAMAQPAPMPGPGSMPGHGPMMEHEHHGFDRARMQERRAQRMAERLAWMKQQLRITPAQEGAWNAWTASLQPARMQRPDRAELDKLTTPERIDRMRTLRNARMAEMDKRAEATKAFYAALSPGQKKVFDTETARARHERMGHRRG